MLDWQCSGSLVVSTAYEVGELAPLFRSKTLCDRVDVGLQHLVVCLGLLAVFFDRAHAAEQGAQPVLSCHDLSSHDEMERAYRDVSLSAKHAIALPGRYAETGTHRTRFSFSTTSFAEISVSAVQAADSVKSSEATIGDAVEDPTCASASISDRIEQCCDAS